MQATDALPAGAVPLANLAGAGSSSNDARVRLLEKRLAGQDSVEAEAAAVADQPAPNAPPLQPGAYAPRQPLANLTLPVQFQALPAPAPPGGAAGQRGVAVPLASGKALQQTPAPGPPPNKRKRTGSPLENQPPAQQANQASRATSPGPLDPAFGRDAGHGGSPQPPAAQRNLFSPGPASLPPQPTSVHKPGGKAAGAKGAAGAGGPAGRSSGGAGAAGGGAAVASKTGQTTLNAYFPVVDGSSRDSELSSGHSGAAAPQAPLPTCAATCVTSSGIPAAAPRPGPPAVSPGRCGPPLAPSGSSAAVARSLGAGPGGVSPLRPTAPIMPPLGRQTSGLTAIPEERGPGMMPSSTADVAAAVSQATAALRQQLEAAERQALEAQRQARAATASLEKQLADLSQSAAAASARADALAAQLDKNRLAAEEREAKMRVELMRSLSASAKDRRELARLRLATAGVSLGSIAVHRTGMALQEVWEEGTAAAALSARQAAIVAQREEVEAARKALRKKLAPPPSAARAAAGLPDPPRPGGPDGYIDGLEFVTLDEIYKTRLAALKREEEAVAEEVERLTAEKTRHVRAIKRLRDEEGSRFSCGSTVLGNRFVLLSMLGKGGFSEVFKAYDLRDLRVVAAKVHQLSPGWSEARKASYVKHAIREVDIQKALRHAHIVGLVDILEIDAHCFATVLEFCEGGDLDTLVRDHQTLPEKEARSIISQVMSGLAYLNQPGRRIIHYDLKPANILFDALGAAKITDFGLSKIVDEGATQGMELTSQGAGTYWYLPPEVFEIGGPQAPRITNKVDVWSVGVIFYQMLYGRRPYGEGLSQEQIMRDRVLLGAREVEFPARPPVSADAKAFIRRCLALRPEARWDVATAAADPYISGRRGAGPPAQPQTVIAS